MKFSKEFDKVIKSWREIFIDIFEQGYIYGQKDTVDKAYKQITPDVKRKIDLLVKKEKKK